MPLPVLSPGGHARTLRCLSAAYRHRDLRPGETPPRLWLNSNVLVIGIEKDGTHIVARHDLVAECRADDLHPTTASVVALTDAGRIIPYRTVEEYRRNVRYLRRKAAKTRPPAA